MIRFLLTRLQLLILLLPLPTSAQIVTDSLDCFYTLPPNTEISMQVAWTSAKHKEFASMIPITVNLNPQTDSIPELLAQLVTNVGDGKLLFFRGDGPVGIPPDTLSLPFSHYFMTPVAGDVDLDGIPEVVLSTSDRYIQVFRHYTPGANPPMALWITSDLQVRNIGFRPLLADLNGDGVPEVVAGDEVFIFDFTDPAAPKLRKVLDANGYFGANKVASDIYLSAPAIADILTPADCGGDPDCNGQEIVAGPVIYAVDIDTTDGDGFQIKVVRDLNTQVLPDRYSDGYTAVADLDLDGIPDIAVDGVKNPNSPNNELGVYVWNKNGFLKFMPRPESMTPSPFIYSGFLTIANVFDDRKRGLARDFPEILSSGNDYLVCQNLHGTSFSNYSAWWYLPVATSHWGSDATAFDFNGDGYAEIVWDDGRNLRILYGGHLPFPPGVDPERNWASIPNINYGFDNYPVVADVDNDGQTEIAILVRDSFINSFDDTGGAFRVVESAGLPWPPSRPIWNQCTYNIVNVNDDASIPAQPQKQWLEYPNPGSDFRPLNMHLGQLPLLGPNFLPVFPLPDASVLVDSTGCDPNNLKIYLKLCNTGDAKLPPGTSVQFYLDNPAGSAAVKYGPPLIVPFSLPVDTCLSWTAVLPMPSNGTLWGVINDNGTKPAPFDLATDFPSTTRRECDYTNNLFSTVVAFTSPTLELGADQAVCPQVAVLLDAGTGFSKYQWQDGATGSTYLAQGPGTYWVQAWDVCGNLFADSTTLSPVQTQPLALGPDVALCAGDSLQLNFPGFDQLQWATTSGILCNDCPSLTLQLMATQTLWATAISGGCTLHDTLTIQVHAVPELFAQVTATSCGANNGAIDLQIAQGMPPYQIGWSGGLSGTQPSNLPPGQYTVTISDVHACSMVATYTIAGSSGPEVEDVQLTPVACFGENTGQIAVNVSGGVAPYQYTWSTGPGSALLPDLLAGDYGLTVTDANSCSTTAGYTVPEPPPLFLQVQVDSTDCSSTTASIAVGGQGGTGPYAYAWSSGQQVSTLNSVLPGTYTVTVSDVQGCTLAQTFTVLPGGAPNLAGSQLTPVACFGENTGQIAVDVSGGVAPYNYTWSTGPGGALLPDLPAGDYGLTVTDANGCSTTAGFTVPEPPALFLQTQMDSTDCSNTTASIAVDGQGGTGPYAYAWSSGQQVSTLNSVLPGSYTVTISDAQGCTLAQTFVVPLGGAPNLAGSQLMPVTCFGENTGQIAVDVSGGVAPYQYNWSTGPGGALLPDLPAGDYALTITDANGCSTTAGFTVVEPPVLMLSIDPDAIPCAGMTGGLAAIVQGGTPGYVYAWDTGFMDQHPTGLPAGQYAVTVTDLSGCSISTDVLLSEPPPLNLQGTISPVLCTQPGSISVDIQGGTAPYNYAWNTGHVAPVIDGLAAGAFTVTVSDANGCSAAQTFTLAAPAVPLVSDTVLTPVRCFDESSGEIQLTLVSGTPPYQIQWSNGSAGASVSGLSAGTYSATVTDSGDCSFTVTLNLTQPEALEVSALTIADTCARQTGAIDLSATGGVLPYSVLWSDGQTTEDRQALAAGSWSVTLTDGNGCVFSQTVEVPAVMIQPLFSLSADTVTCTTPMAGLAVVPAPGGWSFQWKTPGGNLLTGAQQNVRDAGIYQVTVTNVAGCSAAQSINVVTDTIAPQAKIATPGIVYIPCDQTSVILAGSSTSVGPGIESRWVFQSNGQNNWDTLATSIAANIPGIYLFQVLDTGNGCSATDTVELQALPGIDALALEVDSVSCFGLSDAEIRISSVSGGVPPYSYSIAHQPFVTNAVFSGLGAGTYAIAVQDAEGCTFETNVILAQPDSFYVTLEASGTILTEGQSLLLKARLFPPGFSWANIEWFPPSLFTNPLLLTQLVKPAETTPFEIVVSDQEGCTAAAGVLVQVEQTGVYLPNAIYSGRPANAIFTVFAGADVESVRLLRIFDRWGELLFEHRDFSPNDPAQGWDATFRGENVAPGVYVYYLVVKLANGNELELRGDVTVFR